MPSGAPETSNSSAPQKHFPTWDIFSSPFRFFFNNRHPKTRQENLVRRLRSRFRRRYQESDSKSRGRRADSDLDRVGSKDIEGIAGQPWAEKAARGSAGIENSDDAAGVAATKVVDSNGQIERDEATIASAEDK